MSQVKPNILSFLALLVLLGNQIGCQKNPPPPPIILLSIDTLRADHLGCYGYPRNTSPHLDSLAEESVIFLDAFSAAPNTAPAHMSIFTSLSPVIHGVRNFGEKGRKLPESIPTLAFFLNQQGYLTVGLHGGGNVGRELGFAQGFDRYEPGFFRWPEGKGILVAGLDEWDDIEDKIKGWIELSREKNQPIFLFLHHYLCHDPYLSGPKEYRLRFLNQPVPGLPLSLNDLTLGDGFMGIRERFFGPADFDNPAHIQHYLDLYDGGVFYSDYIFGQIRRILEEENLFDSALIIVLSDHGEEFQDHDGLLHWKLFRETIQVPLILHFPGGKFGGQKITTPVTTMDLFPTIAAWLGTATIIPDLQGKSLLSLVEGKGKYEGDPVSFSGKGDSLRLIRGEATYINQAIDGVKERVYLRSDRKEKQNLAKARGGTKNLRVAAKQVMDENKKWQARSGNPNHKTKPQTNPQKIRELKALGYLN